MSVLAATLPVLGQMRGDHMDGWDNGTSWWMVAVMSIFAVVVIAAIVVGAIALSRTGRHQPPAGPATPSPIDILNQRYARGEIDTADYEERKRLLG